MQHFKHDKIDKTERFVSNKSFINADDFKTKCFLVKVHLLWKNTQIVCLRQKILNIFFRKKNFNMELSYRIIQKLHRFFSIVVLKIEYILIWDSWAPEKLSILNKHFSCQKWASMWILSIEIGTFPNLSDHFAR